MQPVKKTTRRKPRKAKNQTSFNSGQPKTTVPADFRGLTAVFPPRMRLRLVFNDTQALSLAAGFSNYRYRPTAAFDIDPALGGTSMAGFAEAAAFYASYRVVSSRIKVTSPNPSATVPYQLIVLPMNADPTNSFSGANVLSALENPYAKNVFSGLLGSPVCKITSEMTTTKIYGDPATYFDHNFSSLVTTVPANNWFWNICIRAPAFSATAVYVNVTIECDIEFFDRIFLPN